MAKRHNKPVIGIAACLTADSGVVHEHGIDAIFSILNNVSSIEETMANAAINVRLTSRNIAATGKLASGLLKPLPDSHL